MENRNQFESNAVVGLFHHTGLNAPLPLKADTGDCPQTAVLQGDGSVEMNGQRYANIDVAMGATPQRRQQPGDAWQFWSWYNEDRRIWSPLAQLRAKQPTPPPSKALPSSLAPSRAHIIHYPKGAGKVGFMACPGSHASQRSDAAQELRALQKWGCATVISVVESHEFTMLGAPDLCQEVQQQNMIWLHLPIRDHQAPDSEFEAKWRQVGPLLHRQLISGSNLIFHCHNGQSRSALACGRLLIEAGLSSAQVLRILEPKLTAGFDSHQESYLRSQAWNPQAAMAEGA